MVTWEWRGKVEWWAEDVIDLDDSDSVIGTVSGTIRYHSRRGYEAECRSVVFDISPKEGLKTLQHVVDGEASRES